MVIGFELNKQEILNTSRFETSWGPTDEGARRPVLQLPLSGYKMFVRRVGLSPKFSDGSEVSLWLIW